MHSMIHAQPAYAEEAIDRVWKSDFGKSLSRAHHLVLTGCGTSFHAAMYGAKILQDALGTRCVAEAIHAYALAFGPFPPGKATVLGVSHSGSTPTTNRALARAKRRGLRVLGVCGLADSIMERIVDRTLVIGSTHDRSWANTMSYTTQLIAFAILAAQQRLRWAAVRCGGLGTFEKRGGGHGDRRPPASVDSAPRHTFRPAADCLRDSDAIHRLLCGPRTAREPGHHADGYSPTSCGSGGAVPLTATAGGIPTQGFVSDPFRSIRRRSILPLP